MHNKDYAKARKEQNKKYASNYYYAHREKCLENAKKYRERIKDDPTHKEKVRERSIARYHNPKNNLNLRLRHRIYMAIKRGGHIKNKQTEEILGCSIDDFKNYIATLFQPGMSWDNYGEWHLDHIKPLSLATTDEEVYQLCHYTNYQPLWAIDNLKKGNRYDQEEACNDLKTD